MSLKQIVRLIALLSANNRSRPGIFDAYHHTGIFPGPGEEITPFLGPSVYLLILRPILCLQFKTGAQYVRSQLLMIKRVFSGKGRMPLIQFVPLMKQPFQLFPVIVIPSA